MTQRNLTSTSMKTENLINELKGNLFEFLVGGQLARRFQKEATYFHSLPPYFLDQLKKYEDFLRKNDPGLVRALPVLANKVTEEIFILWEQKWNQPNLENISLVGKLTGGSHDGRFAEADLILHTSAQDYPISIKLCKEKSFVNTKNAGVRSFIKKYFSSFANASLCQEDLNLYVDEIFRLMALELFELAGLDFQGKFDERWENKFSTLPGELPADMRKIVLNFYDQIISKIYEMLNTFSLQNRNLFLQCLYPLFGFGNKDIIQICCFHGTNKKLNLERYHFKGVKSILYEEVEREFEHIELKDHRDGLSSFNINFLDTILQIRAKPMNTFCVPAVKINCSVKHLILN